MIKRFFDSFFIPNNKSKDENAFTIVELLIVIVIIGILAAIVFVSYSGISRRANEAKLISDLTNASKLVSIDYMSNDSIPTIFPVDTVVSDGVSLSLSDTGSSDSYCINAKNDSNDMYMYYLSTNGEAQDGNCSGSVVPGSEFGAPENITLDDSFSDVSGSGWRMSLSDSSGVSLSTRVGTSSDPIENKPVLVFTNSTSKTESWSVLNGQISYSDVIVGETYQYSLWVRKIGAGYSNYSVLSTRDGNGTNDSLTFPNNFDITDSWKEITGTAVANQNGFSGNLYYLCIDTASFTNVGWSLEFQEPQLFKVD